MSLEEQLTQTREAVLAQAPSSALKAFHDSLEKIKNDQLKEKALQPGQKIQDFQLIDTQGHEVSISHLHTIDFLVLNFYRGGWCPYCNMELRAYEKLRQDFLSIGADIVAISAEKTTLAASTSDKNQLSFPVLTDKEAHMMKAMGIVYSLDEASKREYTNFGLDLATIHGNDQYQLPVPAVYVINRAMEIVFVHFEEDYTTRLEPQELLNTLQNQLKFS